MNNSLKLETLCVQGGWQPKKGEPRVLPFIPTAIIKAVLACAIGLNLRKRIPGLKA